MEQRTEQFIIAPEWSAGDSLQTLTFDVGRVNKLARARYNDHIGFYQQRFGIYSYMRLNHLLQYKIHYPVGSPLLIQPHDSCAWTPQGDFRMASETISPFPMKINVEQCYDETFNSTFEAFMEWGGDATVSMSAGGVEITNAMVDMIMGLGTLGARAVLTAGGNLLTGNLKFASNLSTNLQEAYVRSAGTGNGWIQLLRSMKAQSPDKYSHLDNPLVAEADVSNDTHEYTGDVIALYDARVAASPHKLKSAVKRGGRGGFGGVNVPIWLVSPAIHDRMYHAKLDQDAQVAQNATRIRTEVVQVDNGRSGTSPMVIYFIDNTAVIPVDEIEVFEEYLQGTAYFDYLTFTGVIQLGGSWSALPNRGSTDVALRIQRSERNEDYGKTTYLSHMLGAVGLNSREYIAGGFEFFEPAPAA